MEIVKKTGMKWIYFLLEAEQFQLMSEGLLAMNIIAMLQNGETLSILNQLITPFLFKLQKKYCVSCIVKLNPQLLVVYPPF